MEKETEQVPTDPPNTSMIREIPVMWKVVIVAVVLLIIIGIVAILWKSVGGAVKEGGKARKGRWGARGGDCGCSAAPMP